MLHTLIFRDDDLNSLSIGKMDRRECLLPLPLGFMAVPLLCLVVSESGTVSCEGRASSVGGTAASFIGAANTVGGKDVWLGGVTGSVGAMISSVAMNDSPGEMIGSVGVCAG